ncbi:SpoIIE family protein phosphatase [Streptomyces tuirus]|uniref:SpoIIE family protein phosphatase n=1 Tax=Streptomyces tuirus TaxID=68278 RepID=UPI003435FD83
MGVARSRPRSPGPLESLRPAQAFATADGLVERRGKDIDVSLQELAALSLPADGALDDLLDTLLSGMANGAYEDDVAILAARQP